MNIPIKVSFHLKISETKNKYNHSFLLDFRTKILNQKKSSRKKIIRTYNIITLNINFGFEKKISKFDFDIFVPSKMPLSLSYA